MEKNKTENEQKEKDILLLINIFKRKTINPYTARRKQYIMPIYKEYLKNSPINYIKFSSFSTLIGNIIYWLTEGDCGLGKGGPSQVKKLVEKIYEKNPIFVPQWKKQVNRKILIRLAIKITELRNYDDVNLVSKYSTSKNKEIEFNISKIRREFRKKLIEYTKVIQSSKTNEEKINCVFETCLIGQNIGELLIASHIWSIKFIKLDKNISNEEKIRSMIDFENGLLLCSNHDKIFDNYFISFDNQGKLVLSNSLQGKEAIYNLSNRNPVDFTSTNMFYMQKHYNYFLLKKL